MEKQPPETPADQALHRRDYAAAEPLYRAAIEAAGSDEAAYALAVRDLATMLVAAQRTQDAVAAVNDGLRKYPENAVLFDAQGEVYFRHGEIAKAGAAYNRAIAADPCMARLRYDMAQFDMLDSQYANAESKLKLAHQLAPWNGLYTAQLASLRGERPSNEKLIEQLTTRMNSDGETAAQKDAIAARIKYLQAQGKGSCRAVDPVPKAKISMSLIANGGGEPIASSLDVSLNGAKRHFELDTGASGLLINRASAQAAGLIDEAEGSVGGVGDQGRQRTTYAHVDDLRIGPLQYRNCLVEISDRLNLPGVDGLIGSDVFSAYLVTLDFPDGDMLLNPLPKRPGDEASTEAPGLNTTGSDSPTGGPQNRYIAPGMEKWTRMLRAGHLLLFPTEIRGGPTRLFLMDTGSSVHEAMISIEAGKDVAALIETNDGIRGISGAVKDVQRAQTVTLTFGGVREELHDVPAINLGAAGFAGGTTISGFIGYKTLDLLILTIDYRDSLVKVEYHRQ